jgi:hypothetical protein
MSTKITYPYTLQNSTIADADEVMDDLNEARTRVNALIDDIATEKDGWNPVTDTFVYSAVDDPTGVITITGDVTTKYSVGMRLRFVNGGNTIYGIITKTPTYSSPNTTITFLHQIDPTDNLALVLMANSAITAPHYSTQKAPFGFPTEPTKWSIEKADIANRTVGTPTAGTYYNVSELNASVPIGSWDSYVKGVLIAGHATTGFSGIIALSTANNSASDAKMKAAMYSGLANTITNTMVFSGRLNLTTKATYYVNIMADTASTAQIGLRGDLATSVHRVTCAYL